MREAQRVKIEGMWKRYARSPTEKALRAFIKRIAKVDHPTFLRPHLAQKVIIALEKIAERSGYERRKPKGGLYHEAT